MDAVPTAMPEVGTTKLEGYNFFKSIGSPQYVVAPMVDASELAWRILSRSYGAQLVYTPMINAGMFNSSHPVYCKEQFDLVAGEEGDATIDRPLIAQFCANDKTQFLESAMALASKGVCDAVDLNLGCPQGIARRGHYGAFLQEDMALIESLIHHLHVHLPIPITAKFRVLDTVEETVTYAKMLERAGAQMLTVHGRLREQKGQLAGLADWTKIEAVKAAVTSIPVLANGNILIDDDIERCLSATSCDGVMSAEGNLYNPALFQNLTGDGGQKYTDQLPLELREAILRHSDDSPSAQQGYPSSIIVARRYLAIVKVLKTQTASSAIKSHLFKLFRPYFEDQKYHCIRDALSRGRPDTFSDIVDQLESLAKDDQTLKDKSKGWEKPRNSENLRNAFSPQVCQPYIRFETVPISRENHDAETTDERPAKRAKLQENAHCSTPGCLNAGAQKCPLVLCSSCCSKDDNCEAHAAKQLKRQAKRERKGNNKKRPPTAVALNTVNAPRLH